MQIQNNYSINFNARVIPEVYKDLCCQAKERTTSKKKTLYQIISQVEKLQSWGRKDSEIVYCQDTSKPKKLGLSCIFGKNKITIPLRGIKGRIELTQFLKIGENDIVNAEMTADKLFKKHWI